MAKTISVCRQCVLEIKGVRFTCTNSPYNFCLNHPRQRHVTIRDTEFRIIFCDVEAGTLQNTTVINAGNDYVLYSILKVFNVSLNIILWVRFIAIVKEQ